MGSANALAAYRVYAGKISSTAMKVLAYMALVALDNAREPSYWEGHEMLAIRCFGRSEPITQTDLRAVERAMTQLFEAGAITTIRHASGHHGKIITARYRLWITEPAPDEKRRKPRSSTRRKTDVHPTKNGRAPDEKRRTKEKEEKEEREIPLVLDLNRTLEVAGSRPMSKIEREAWAAASAGPRLRRGEDEQMMTTRAKLLTGVAAAALALGGCGGFNEANGYNQPDPAGQICAALGISKDCTVWNVHWERISTPQNYETLIFGCLGEDGVFLGQSSGLTVSTFDPNCGATSQVVGK